MKTLRCFLLTLILLGAPALTGWAAATDGTAWLEFTTLSEGWAHSPNHVLAVWITDARTNFITTVLKHGNNRAQHLSTWNAARRGNADVDGVSGATLTSHGVITAAWNCRNRKGTTVPDGTYLFFAEFTEGDFQGPRAVFSFVKGPQAQSTQLARQGNFKAIKVSFVPEK
ncbi:MAG: DUF2271 domain-containing protein [Verrucomicrobiota bacterium]